ncbi:hypothetical protein [Moraxella sp. RCAD0137]|uniref:hypothetical protein n=1 Tax=Moraxella sp. RCAD0137 TaxID=1775913 RepID=UPI0011AF8F24|nr:hypothetical protein [Moraxella sp. RCAD0137]
MAIPIAYANTAHYPKLAVGDWLCHSEYRSSDAYNFQYVETYTHAKLSKDGRFITDTVGRVRKDNVDGVYRAKSEGIWWIDGDRYHWEATKVLQLDYSDRLELVGFGELMNELIAVSEKIIRLDDKHFDTVDDTDGSDPLYFNCTRL